MNIVKSAILSALILFGTNAAAETFEITLKQLPITTPGKENCPAFSVTVNQDGNVTWMGAKGVKMMGHEQSKAEKQATQNLLQSLQARPYNGWQNQYMAAKNRMDTSMFNLEIVMNGKKKSMVGYWSDPNLPEELKSFAENMGDELKIKQWIGNEVNEICGAWYKKK